MIFLEGENRMPRIIVVAFIFVACVLAYGYYTDKKGEVNPQTTTSPGKR